MWRDSKAERATEEVAGFGLDTSEEKMRERVRATIEAIVEEELEAALGARRGARVGAPRRGYRRRTARVDEAILGVYLSGTNSRRRKGALAPLLRGGPLSKDAVSRLVGRLKSDFEDWQQRDLSQEMIRYLMRDGWYPKVRIGRRRVRVPVLVTLGIKADGERIVLDMRLAGQETTGAWQG